MAAPTQEDIQSLSSSIQALTNQMQNAAQSGGADGGGSPNYPGGDPNVFNQLSFALGGGVRVFGLGRVFDALQGLAKPVDGAKKNLLKLQNAFVAAGAAAFGMTAAFNRFSKELGGVTPGQAVEQLLGNIGQSLAGIARGRFLNPLEGLQIQGAFAREFGGLISPQAAALLQEAGQDLGLNVSQLVALERTLQGTGRQTRATIDQFRRAGVGGQVAAEELSKNAAVVARAGSNFNSFIVEGIKNAKRLGLEFSNIEKTLTGFATDFEGTVEGFANLRAVIPGFATDFNQLFSTALYGSTDDFIEQIRSGLLGGGISDISQLNRLQVAELEKATGFTGDQLQRILAGQEAGVSVAQSLDTQRNSLLKFILAAIGSLIGVTAVGLSGVSFGASLGAAVLGGAAGGLLGYGSGLAIENVDDAIIQNGRIIGTNPKDTIIATKTPGDVLGSTDDSSTLERTKTPGDVLGSTAGSSALESKMDKLIITMETQLNVFKNGLFVEMRDMDKAMIRQQEAAVRNF